MRHPVDAAVPAGSVEQEAFLDPLGVLAQLRRKRGPQLEPGGGQRLAEAELGGGAGQRDEERGLRLVHGQSGEPGPVAADQPVAAGMAGRAVQRDTDGAERLHVPVHRPDGDLQFVGQLPGRHPAPVLEQQKQGDQPARTHAVQYLLTEDVSRPALTCGAWTTTGP